MVYGGHLVNINWMNKYVDMYVSVHSLGCDVNFIFIMFILT